MAGTLHANYTSHFGHDHSFHMGHPEMRGGYNRFQYGGYSLGYNQGWPVGWGYNDDFYVEYIDGADYPCDLRFSGVQITLDSFLRFTERTFGEGFNRRGTGASPPRAKPGKPFG